jgi:hypothetical protein
MKRLKLFVWRGVYNDYTEGMACALAKDADEARRIITAATVQWLWNKKKEAEGPPYLITSENWAAVTPQNLDCHMERGLSELSREPEVFECDQRMACVSYGSG